MPLREAMAGAPNIGVVGDHDIVLPHGQRALVDALGWPGNGERFDYRYGPIQLVGLGLRADAADMRFAARALARPGPQVRFVVVHQPPKAGNGRKTRAAPMDCHVKPPSDSGDVPVELGFRAAPDAGAETAQRQ